MVFGREKQFHETRPIKGKTCSSPCVAAAGLSDTDIWIWAWEVSTENPADSTEIEIVHFAGLFHNYDMGGACPTRD